MKNIGKLAKNALVGLLILMLLWTNTALAQETFTNGYFTYQIPEGMQPDGELSRKTQYFSWDDDVSMLCAQSIPMDSEDEWTLDKLQTERIEVFGHLTLHDEIRIEAQGVESWVGVAEKIEMAPNVRVDVFVLAAQKEEQLFMTTFLLADERIAAEQHYAFFCNWVDTIVVNDIPEWSELIQMSGQQDRYEEGLYYLSDADAYVEVDDQINEVFVRNPPTDKDTLAKRNGYTAERMREALSRHDADMLIYPQQYPEMTIRVSMVADQSPEDMTFTPAFVVKELLNSQEARSYGMKAYHSKGVSYMYIHMGIEGGQDQSVYMSVVNGNDIYILISSKISLTDEMIAYAENIIDHITFGNQ